MSHTTQVDWYVCMCQSKIGKKLVDILSMFDTYKHWLVTHTYALWSREPSSVVNTGGRRHNHSLIGSCLFKIMSNVEIIETMSETKKNAHNDHNSKWEKNIIWLSLSLSVYSLLWIRWKFNFVTSIESNRIELNDQS